MHNRRSVLGSWVFVPTVGFDETMVRAYIRNQEEEEDERYDQMKLGL
jgi:putative transposase